MTENENLEIQFELLDLDIRLEYIQVKLAEEEISEEMRKRYLLEFDRLKHKYKFLQDQLTNEYVRRIR